MSDTTQHPEILKTKNHFEILDGLRGIAAIAIVVFHFMEIIITDFTKNFIAHGFLAVDFFFCLSGFVIAYAYDDRMLKMGILEFLKSRIIRLHPLVLLGTVLGLLAFFFDPYGGNAAGYNAWQVFKLFLTSALMIPYPVMEERFFNNFGLNAPAWSLFWEYVANIFYALVLIRMGRKSVAVLAAIAAIVLGYVVFRAGSIVGGWGGDTFWDGGARIAYSFLAGVLIFRFKLIIKSRIGFIGLTFLLLLAFIMPYSWGWIAELGVVLVYFPLIIALGAGAKVSDGLKGLCKLSGDISYPLYMTHYAVIFIFLNYFTLLKPSTAQLSFIVIGGTAALIGFAYIIMVGYDIPVRKYLSAKRNNK